MSLQAYIIFKFDKNHFVFPFSHSVQFSRIESECASNDTADEGNLVKDSPEVFLQICNNWY